MDPYQGEGLRTWAAWRERACSLQRTYAGDRVNSTFRQIPLRANRIRTDFVSPPTPSAWPLAPAIPVPARPPLPALGPFCFPEGEKACQVLLQRGRFSFTGNRCLRRHPQSAGVGSAVVGEICPNSTASDPCPPWPSGSAPPRCRPMPTPDAPRIPPRIPRRVFPSTDTTDPRSAPLSAEGRHIHL